MASALSSEEYRRRVVDVFPNGSPGQLHEDAIRPGDEKIASNGALIGPRADHRATCFSVV
jgi:hypothetical protein